MPSGWKCDKLFIEKAEELWKRNKGENDRETVKLIMKMCGSSERQAYDNLVAVKEYLNIKNTIAVNRNVEEKLKPTMLKEISKATQEQKKEIIKGLENETLKTVKDVESFRTGKVVEHKENKEKYKEFKKRVVKEAKVYWNNEEHSKFKPKENLKVIEFLVPQIGEEFAHQVLAVWQYFKKEPYIFKLVKELLGEVK